MIDRRVKTRCGPSRIFRHDTARGHEWLLLTNAGERSLSVFDAASPKEPACVEPPANPTALPFHPTKPEAYVWFLDDELRVLNRHAWRCEREITTLHDPDAPFVITH